MSLFLALQDDQPLLLLFLQFFLIHTQRSFIEQALHTIMFLTYQTVYTLHIIVLQYPLYAIMLLYRLYTILFL